MPVSARVGQRSEQPLRLRELCAHAPVLHLARGARELPRPALEDLIRCVGFPFAERAEQDARPLDAILVPGWGLRDERDEIVEIGALDLHRDSVGEGHHPQPAIRVLGGSRGQELLETGLAGLTV